MLERVTQRNIGLQQDLSVRLNKWWLDRTRGGQIAVSGHYGPTEEHIGLTNMLGGVDQTAGHAGLTEGPGQTVG